RLAARHEPCRRPGTGVQWPAAGGIGEAPRQRVVVLPSPRERVMVARSSIRAPRPAHAVFALLVLMLALLPGFTACSAGVPQASPLNPPPCSSVSGLAIPPAPIKPLTWPVTPVVPGTQAGTIPGHGSTTATGEYQYRIPIDVPAGRAGM